MIKLWVKMIPRNLTQEQKDIRKKICANVMEPDMLTKSSYVMNQRYSNIIRKQIVKRCEGRTPHIQERKKRE